MRAPSASVSIRTSPTALSSSVCDTLGLHLWVVDDARDRDDIAAADDERPCLPLRPGNFGVYEHVLDLFPPACEPVAGPPASYLKACEVGFDLPLAPADRAVEGDVAALEPEPVVFAHGLQALPEVDPLG